MGHAERVSLIKEIEEKRGTRVITYITSTRSGLESSMAMDVIPIVHKHLREVAGTTTDGKIDLFIHSNGGDGTVPWRLVTLCREFCSEFSVLVPNRAFSAATLTALGADRVVMHRMGMLGPTDPTVTTPFNPPDPTNPGRPLGISVEDVASYIALVKEDVGIQHEDELVQAFLALAGDRVHPLALGTVKRSTSQSRMLAEKLLRSRQTDDIQDHEMSEIIRSLTSQLFYHGHPINRGEAQSDLGLTFVESADDATEALMWALFEDYEDEMQLNGEFNPLVEASKHTPVPPPPAPGTPPPGVVTSNVVLGPLPTVRVESATLAHVYELTVEVTTTREWTGSVDGNLFITPHGWRVDDSTA